jgi:3-deoxy-D-manno-octulosonic-acid transferase
LYQIYSLLLAIAFVLALPFYWWKDRATGRYLRSFRERMGALAPRASPGPGGLWIHAVSVGEVLAARPLVAALKAQRPGRPVFLSTVTATGNQVAATAVRGADGLFFAPFDFPGPVRSALTALGPKLLVLVETEIWPNLIHEARRRGVKVALVNGRISARSFARYAWVRPFLRRVLAEVDLFLMQGEAHAERIRALGAPAERVTVTGNLKFDAVLPPRPSADLADRLGLEARGGRPLLIAGSTGPGEEEQVLRAFLKVRAAVPDALLLLVPRHPERFEGVASLIVQAGFDCRRRSTLAPGGWRGDEVVLLDTMGELAAACALGDVVFVGGSLVPLGGHNVLEPAAAGKPIVVGPHMENFQEIADAFRAEGALVQVPDERALGEEVAALLGDAARRAELGRRAADLLARNRGAVERTAQALAALLA